MTVPREVGLIRTEEGGYLLTQRPVAEIRNFRDDTSKVELSDRTIDTPGIPLDTLVGDALEIEFTFEPGMARDVGLVIKRGPKERTRIGYDVARSTVFVDGSGSMVSLQNQSLPGRHDAQLRPDPTGLISLTVLLDRTSVEVFSGDGRAVITDVVLASRASLESQFYVDGGSAHLRSLHAWRLHNSLR